MILGPYYQRPTKPPAKLGVGPTFGERRRPRVGGRGPQLFPFGSRSEPPHRSPLVPPSVRAFTEGGGHPSIISIEIIGEKANNPMYGRTGALNPMYGRTGALNP